MSGSTANGSSYYGSQAAAVAYLSDSITTQAAAFVAALSSKQQQALVSAARVLDRQIWIGTADTFAKRDAIGDIVSASYVLASLLLAKPNLFDQNTASSNVQSVTAGPTNVTFFGPTDVGRFPPSVQELVAPYLSGSASSESGGAERLGDCAESQFDDCDRYGLTRGA
jgi:hypothetical protein